MIKILITIIALLLTVFLISRQTTHFVISPQFAFVVSFIPSLLMLPLFIEKWELNLDNHTVILIVSGALVFALVSFFSEKLISKIRINGFGSRYNHLQKTELEDRLIGSLTLVLFIITSFVGVVVYFFYVSSFTGSFSINSFSAMLMNYRNAYNEESLDMPAFVSVLSMIATCISYYCVFYYLKKRIILKRFKLKKFLLAICIIPGIIIPMLSGARGGIINFVIFVFGAAMITSAKELKVQRKTIRIAIIVAIVIVATLRIGGIYMGRDINDSAIDYIGMYLPAPVRNLDYIIQTEDIGLFAGFGDGGNRTFSKLLNYLSYRFGLKIIPATGRRTLMVNGHYTGNMYTAYYNLLHDAGYIGALLLIALTAFLCQLLFVAIKKDLQGRNTKYPKAIVYTMIYSYLYLSFFNENFFYNVCTNYFIRQVVFFYLIDWFVRKTGMQARRHAVLEPK